MTTRTDTAGQGLGLCRKSPVLRTAPAVLMSETGTAISSQPGRSPAPAGRGGSIRHGIRIGTGSIMALFRERSLVWFVILSSLVMLILPLVRWWRISLTGPDPPFLFTVLVSGKVLVNTFMVFDINLLLLEMVCLSCFTLVLAGLILHRNNPGKNPAPVRESFFRINGHTGSLLGLAMILAVVAWLAYEVISQTRLFGGIAHSISMAIFHLPYAYYFSNELSGALYFAFELMVINLFVLLIALHIIPGIVLGNQRLLPALAGSGSLLKRSWREVLGCGMVFGLIFLGVAAIALMIGQSPLLLGHDYDFFLQVSRGQVLMTAVCYGFVVACWAVMAAGLTAAGIAVADLYAEQGPESKSAVSLPVGPGNPEPA